MYATGSDSNGIVSLFTVNTLTGYATLVGNSDQGTCGSGLVYPGPPAPPGTLVSAHNISDISFSTGGTLYALFVTVGSGGTGSPCLGSLNTGTGAETDVGAPPTGMAQAGDGFATSASNVHYGADPFGLYTVSTSTGKATLVAPFSGGVNGDGICSTGGLPPIPPIFPNGVPPLQPVDAMKFNNGGVLYASINCGRGFVTGDSFLAKITTSGAITVIHETEDATGTSLGMNGIAWGPQLCIPREFHNFRWEALAH